MKKLFALMLACTLMFTLGIPAFAAEVTPTTNGSAVDVVVVDGDGTISPHAPNIPTSSTSLPYTATVTNLCEGCGTYTLFYFKTTTGNLKIGGSLKSSGDKNDTSRYAVIELYEVNNTTVIDSYTVEQFAGSTNLSHTFRNLSSDKNYYLLIKNTTGWGGFLRICGLVEKSKLVSVRKCCC